MIQTKESLRTIAKAARDGIPPEQQAANALLLRDQFLASLPLPAKATVSAYMPIQSEISPLPLLEALRARGHKTLMPCTPGHMTTLEFRDWTPGTPMRNTSAGFPEPADLTTAAYIPDVILMPVLAFDKEGRRLGYGAGTFDRTLVAWRGKIPFLTVGIAHQLQFIEAGVPADALDYTLDLCVTNERVYPFRAGASIWWL